MISNNIFNSGLLFSDKNSRLKREQLEFLSDFISENKTISEFFTFVDRDNSADFEPITYEQLKQKDCFSHEMAHAKAWQSYKIDFQFGLNKAWNLCATTPTNFSFVCKDASREKLIAIFKDVCIAPYNEGLKRGVTSDLVFYETLNGNFNKKTTLLNAQWFLSKNYPQIEIEPWQLR